MHAWALLVAACILFCACSFENKSLPPIKADGTWPADSSRDQASDRPTDLVQTGDRPADLVQPADQPSDQPPDVVDSRCLGTGSSYFCDYEEDSAGKVGHCEDERFVTDRFCFAEAPCNSLPWKGCMPAGGCNPCPSVSCAGVCSLFIDGLGNSSTCCVTPSPHNSDGLATDSCASHQQCRSGLCATAGRCFQACSAAGSGGCPAGWLCQPVEVVVAGKRATANGCVPPTEQVDAGPAPDASPSPPDLAPADQRPAEASLGHAS